MTPRYTPFYCEENVWHLLRDNPFGLDDAQAVFVTNHAGSVAVWSQRACHDPGQPMVWDYHVVGLGRLDGSWTVVDLDCTAGAPLSVATWVEASFPFAGVIPPDLEPNFRVVPASMLFDDFRTDRSHMRDDAGEWLAPPPSWPPISDDTNLRAYLDPSSDAPGDVLDVRHFLARFASDEVGHR